MAISNIVTKSLNCLFLEKRIFNSEADFQFAFSWKIKELVPEVDVILEYTPWKYDKSIRIDIVLFVNGVMIPIELKYKTKNFQGVLANEEIFLKNQGAQDIGRYDFLADIQRLESIIDSKTYNIIKGYAILLTNDKMYWNKPTSNMRVPVDDEFRIHNGIVLNGVRSWKEEASVGTKKNREHPINIRGTYDICWESYVPIAECQFKFLIVEVR